MSNLKFGFWHLKFYLNPGTLESLNPALIRMNN
jgi:hypothetical protein